MKISIGSKIVDGPFGGGNEYIRNLYKFLSDKGHNVINHLNDNDIDIILLTSPLINSETSTFSNYDVSYYQQFINKNSISFHRINECDERKGTKNVNLQIINSNKYIDSTFFVSEWLKDLFLEKSDFSNYHVIKGGPTSNIFNTDNKNFWNKNQKVKIVTHHWSDNYLKGFEEYLALDSLLSSEEMSNKIEFTYIGNIPKNIKFRNCNVIKPLVGIELSEELKKHHIYITGSKNEPSGNHHMEGAMCGLPILYVESGALPEYCKDFGVPFTSSNLLLSINEIIKNYDTYKQNLETYPYTFEASAKNILEIFNFYLKDKNNIVKNRKSQNKLFLKMKINLFYLRKFLKNIYYSIKIQLGKLK